MIAVSLRSSRVRATVIRILAATVLSFTAGVGHTQQWNPNHLEPMPEGLDEYEQVVRTRLVESKSGRQPECWMIALPSFSPEFAVILESAPASHRSGASGKESTRRRWFVVAAITAEPIWRYKEHPPAEAGPLEFDFRRNVAVNRIEREIDEASAKVLEKAWTSAVDTTRLADGYYRGNDGATYEFCAGNKLGETWSPRDGVPAAIEHLANELFSAVRQPGPNGQSALRLALADARKIPEQAAAAIAADPKNVWKSSPGRSKIVTEDLQLDRLPKIDEDWKLPAVIPPGEATTASAGGLSILAVPPFSFDYANVWIAVDRPSSTTAPNLHISVTSNTETLAVPLFAEVLACSIKITDREGHVCHYTEHGKELLTDLGGELYRVPQLLARGRSESWSLDLGRCFQLTPGTWDIEFEVTLTVKETPRVNGPFRIAIVDPEYPGRQFTCRIQPTKLRITIRPDYPMATAER